MKKIIIVLMVLISAFVVACKDERKLTVLLPSGTPLMAVAGLLDNEKYQFEVVSGPDLLVAAMASESHDLIIAPVNAGVKAYLTGGSKYQMAAIVTLGNNYVVSKTDTPLATITDLQDKDILAYGQNNVPDIILKAALKAGNVTANLDYQNGVNDVVSFLLCNGDNCTEAKYILTAEPTLTMIQEKQNTDVNILDLQAVLSEIIEVIPQASLYVKPDTDKQLVKAFLNDLSANITALNANPTGYVEENYPKHKFFETLTKSVFVNCLPRSNIKYLVAKDNTDILDSYYDIVDEYNSKVFNGERPDAAFYY